MRERQSSLSTFVTIYGTQESRVQGHETGRTGYVPHQLQHLEANPAPYLGSGVELALITELAAEAALKT